MAHRGPDQKHPGEGRADWLSRQHAHFIVDSLKFGTGLEVEKTEVTAAYKKWLGIKNFYPPAVTELHALINGMCVQNDPKGKKFIGVRLRE